MAHSEKYYVDKAREVDFLRANSDYDNSELVQVCTDDLMAQRTRLEEAIRNGDISEERRILLEDILQRVKGQLSAYD